ncbi:hypothetical protein JCM19000A_22040 [Silvimonas sp. JCM 19000]
MVMASESYNTTAHAAGEQAIPASNIHKARIVYLLAATESGLTPSAYSGTSTPHWLLRSNNNATDGDA